VLVQARPRRPGPGRAALRPDAGFTLIEVLVALGLIMVVGAAAAIFHTTVLDVTRRQANRQVAAQLTTRAVDAARASGGPALLASPPTPVTMQVNGVAFTQRWTVTVCRQAVIGGPCTTAAAAPGTAEMVEVAVSVQWTEKQQVQSQRAVVLLSAAPVEPTFTS
jgi:Tfp pilus assembly protein PilV